VDTDDIIQCERAVFGGNREPAETGDTASKVTRGLETDIILFRSGIEG